MIGPITAEERLAKVVRYFEKKRFGNEKHVYRCRAKVAQKRLRIKGRFVTKEQAFEILGLSKEDLHDNVQLQELLTQFASDELNEVKLNTIITNTRDKQKIKVQNFHELIDDKLNSQ